MCQLCQSVEMFNPTFTAIERAVGFLIGAPYVLDGAEMLDLVDRTSEQPVGIAMLAGQVMMTWESNANRDTYVTFSL